MTNPSSFEASLRQRADDRCELCASQDHLAARAVAPKEAAADTCVLLCDPCAERMAQDPLDAQQWYGLKEAAWNQTPAVQVTCWRLLSRLASEGWAAELLQQLYLEEDVLAWAQQGREPASDADAEQQKPRDSNGTELHDGDSVTLIQDLEVKGAGFTAKRGTLVKNIRLTDDPAYIDARLNKVAIALKTCFLKRA